MLKKRIIPVQLLMGSRLVKTVGFDTWRDVGDPVASSRVYNSQDADELILLNIERSNRSVRPLGSVIEKVSEVCFMPLSVGGGIASLEDVETLIRNGADKVVINSACYRDLGLVHRAADKFGSQAIVASIDVRYDDAEGRYVAYSDCGRKREAVRLEDHVPAVVKAGAGELFINSIARDGSMTGYDLPFIKTVMGLSPLPVIACGGAGHYMHLKEAFQETGVDALACGSLFNFGDNNPLRAKASLVNYGIPFKVI